MSTPLRILVLEDQPTDAELILHEVRRAGFALEWQRVESEEAYLTALHAPPEIILSDYSMPRFDGLRALALLQERGLDIPFILISGTLGEETAVEAMKQGATDYLLKDRLARLGPAVRRALSEKALRDAHRRANEDLRRSQAALAQAGTMAHLGAWEIEVERPEDFQANRLIWSDEVFRIFGYAPGAVAVNNTLFFEHVYPDDRERVARGIQQAIATRQPYCVEHRVIRSDGTERVVLEHAEVLYDGGGRPTRILGAVQDITERKQAEAALAEEAVRRRIFIEQSSDGIVVMNGEGKVVEANRRYAEMLGYSPEEMLRLHVWDWDAQWSRDQLVEMLQQVGDSGLHLETRHRRKDRSIIDVEITSNGVQVGGRKLVFAVCRDISERKQVEAALQRSEAFTRTVLNNLPVGIAVNSLSPSVAFLFMNDNFPRLYRTTREALAKADDFWTAVYEDPVFRDEMRKRVLADCASGDPARMFWQDIPIQRAGGPTAFITARNIPLPEEGLVISTVWDVTSQKQAEAALRTSEEQFRAMFELASIGMAQADPRTGQWLRVNRRFCTITGYSAEELFRMRVPEITHPEDRDKDWAAFQRVVRGDASEYHLEKRYVRKDGAIAWVSVNMTVIRDAAGQPVRTLATIEDITTRKRLEEEREVTVRLLGLLNAHTNLRELMQAVTALLRERFDCEAVGIRLREGDDFPYFETRGFPAEFVELENELCLRDAAGEPIRDRDGHPVLECMCGNVLCGRFDPAKPFFTTRGSFWSNDTTRLLATTSPAERQAHTRNRCNAAGYESVALVPLRAGATTFGLVQLNDRRKHRFTPVQIALMERLADSLAMGLAHWQDQDRLRESEALFQSLVQNLRQLVFRKDLAGRFTFANGPLCAALGKPLAEILGKTDADFFPAELAEKYRQDDLRVIESGQPLEVEEVFRSADGREAHVRALKTPLHDAAGKLVGIQGISWDITQRKRAETQAAALGTLGLKLSAAREPAQAAQAIADVGLELFAWDACFLNLYDPHTETLRELLCMDTLDGRRTHVANTAINHRVSPILQRVLKGQGELLLREHPDSLGTTARFGDTTRPSMSLMFVPVRHQGECIGVFSLQSYRPRAYTAQDLETLQGLADHCAGALVRIQSEAALRESEAHYSSLFENMLNGFAYCRMEFEAEEPRDFVYLAVNAAFETLTGLKGVVGKRVSEVIPGIREEDPKLFEAYGRVARSGVPERFEVYVEALQMWFAIAVYCPKPDHFVAVFDVITERKQWEEQLRQMSDRLQLATRAGQIGIWDLDLVQNRLVWDETMFQLYGTTRDQFGGVHEAWRMGLHPDDRSRAIEEVELAMRGEREFDTEFRVVWQDGSIHYIKANAFVQRDAAGRPVRMIGTNWDITERKQAEEAIRRERVLLRTVIDHLPDPIYVKDLRGAKTLANRAEIAWMGLATEDQALGKTDFDVYPQDIAVKTRANDQAILTSGVPVLNREETVIDAKGAPHWVLTSRLPLRDASGAIVGLVGITHDVTERKQAEERVRQLSRAVEQSPATVVITDAEGNIEYVNPKFTRLTGYTLEEARGQNPRILKSGDMPAEAYRELWTTINAGREWRGYFHNRKKSGELYWEYASISPIVDDAGRITHFLAVKEDITERKRLEQERTVMEAQLRQQQKLESIGTLASGVAHEINNPITGIMNYAQLIQDRLPGDSPLAEFTGEIMHETQRVATIVRNLLTFARNEKQSHSPARMVDIVEAALSLVRTVIRHDQIELSVKVAADLPNLNCRSQQLQQVIMNLMTNARDALNERYPGHHPDKLLNLEARLIEKADRLWIRLTVEDHGTGITPEVRERMFDPFFTTKGRDQGTGLGLSISHGIVKEHQGAWTVESEPGRFTRMHVDLPVDEKRET